MAAVSVKRSIHCPNVAYCNHIRRFERFHFHRMHSLRQKYLGHFLWTLFFFCFWPISSPSQFCLSQLTHEILHTNVGRARRQNVSDNFDWDCSKVFLNISRPVRSLIVIYNDKSLGKWNRFPGCNTFSSNLPQERLRTSQGYRIIACSGKLTLGQWTQVS